MSDKEIMIKQITRKEVVATHQHVLKVGYCELSCLLAWRQRYAYTSGVYGWNSDVYSVGNIAISIGYRSFGNIQCSHALCQKYEELASSEITKKEALTDLLYSFIDEAIATDGKGYDNMVEKPHHQFN